MDDYLKQLADWMNENKRQRKEEDMAFSEDVNKKLTNIPMTSNQRFPLTKQTIAQNPNIPQDDVQDYVRSVTNENEENMISGAANIGGLKVLGQAAKPLLGAVAKSIGSKFPSIGKMMANAENKALVKELQEKIKIRDSGVKPNLISEEELIKSYNRVPELDELAKERLRRNADIDVIDHMQEIEKLKRIKNADPESLEKTILTGKNR